MSRDPVSQFRSACYWMGRVAGDLQAARRGPKAVVRRIERRAVYRTVFKALGTLRRV